MKRGDGYDENIESVSKCTRNSRAALRGLCISDVREGFSALHQDQYDVTLDETAGQELRSAGGSLSITARKRFNHNLEVFW